MTSVTILGIAVAVAAPLPRERPKSTPSIVGEWVMERMTLPGLLDFQPNGMTFEFAADGQMQIRSPFSKPLGMAVLGTFKVDSAKNPPELDFTESGNITRRAIYKFEPDGTLLICYPSDSNGPRPTTFESDGVATTLMTLRRADKKE
jgi:uncharacterized protein (TIGR03067 family)